MIREGKQNGWLASFHASVAPWAAFNNVNLDGVEIRPIPGRGLAVIATRAASPGTVPLMVVPKELVLSKENVTIVSLADHDLRAVLEAVGDFGRSPRGAILIFILMQVSRLSPDMPRKIGLSSVLSDYVKMLPLELLPTFWNDSELQLLQGTSLLPATEAKLNSLYREFDVLRTSTAKIDWCESCWWNEVDGLLTFDDWKQLDAFYRSRALEFPGIGDCMAPCIDFANHAAGDETTALYELDRDGNPILLVREGKTLEPGEEVTITYGDEKGACEMLFSYGFLEKGLSSAKDIFMSLEIPDSDPLKAAKKTVATTAPGVRLMETLHGLQWESEYVWLLCVNQEDGLDFEVAQTVTGDSELQAMWHKAEMKDVKLRSLLEVDPLWDIFQLRATVVIQERIERQLRRLYDSDATAVELSTSEEVRAVPRALALQLRELESELLEQFYEYFDNEKQRLAERSTVRAFLQRQSQASEPEDFS